MVVMVADRVMRLTPYFPVPYFVWKAADQFLQEQEETESQRATRMEREYVQSINSPTLAEEDEAFRKEVMKLKERNKVVIRRQEKPNGRAFCHSQCKEGWDILSLEMKMGGLTFPDAKREVYGLLGRSTDPSELNIEATYDYVDENGVLKYQVVREHPKKFKQRHRDGGGQWVWNLRDVDPLPYNLPAIINSTYCICTEGEKDVETLKAHGLPASCNNGGAGNWKPALNHWFTGKQILLIPDNDEKGRQHVLKVAEMLAPIARELKILELPNLPAKCDVTDWFTRGGSVEALRDLVRTQARDWHPDFAFATPCDEDKWVQSPALIIEAAGGMDHAWDMAYEEGIPTPYERLNDSIGGGMRKGEVYILAGMRGSGKTSMLLQFIMPHLEAGGGVLLFSLEMRGIDVLQRLASMEELIDLAQIRILQKKRKKGIITPVDTGFLEQADNRLKRQTQRLMGFSLLVHQKPIITPEYIIEETQRLSVNSKIDLVVVDHMQLMSSDGNEQKDYEKFTAISRALKSRVAKELNIPVLLASQVSRKNSNDNRWELEVTDCRASGAIEEDAAGVFLLYHDKDDMKKALLEGRSAKGPVKAWLKIGKNRFGPSPVYMAMSHHKRCTSFFATPDLDPDRERPSTEEAA
ncbi:unnamed protein product [Sphagnum balticum]